MVSVCAFFALVVILSSSDDWIVKQPCHDGSEECDYTTFEDGEYYFDWSAALADEEVHDELFKEDEYLQQEKEKYYSKMNNKNMVDNTIEEQRDKTSIEK